MNSDNILSFIQRSIMEHTQEGRLLTEIILDTFKLNGVLVLEGDKLVKSLELTSARWKILGALAYGSNPMTVPDIARGMGQSRQAVQRISNEMVEDGLLATLPNPEHKRAKLVKLTDKGAQAYSQAMEKQIPWVNGLASDIKQTELEIAASVLKNLIAQLDKNQIG